MDMDFLLGTILNNEKDRYVHCEGPVYKANTDSSSYKDDANHQSPTCLEAPVKETATT